MALKDHYQILMDEIVRPQPDLNKVKKAAKGLGLKAKGGLLEIMAEVLESMPPATEAKRKPAEVEP